MAELSLNERVETLERKMDGPRSLLARMDAFESQIQQLRREMRDESSAQRERLQYERLWADQRMTGIDKRISFMDWFFCTLHKSVRADISLLWERRGRKKR